MEQVEQVLGVVEEIIKNPGYFPDPETYMNTALNVYRLSTGQAQLSHSAYSPFENLYMIVREKMKTLSCDVFNKPEKELRDYLRTFVRRATFLDHVFEYILKHRASFVHRMEPPTLSGILCTVFVRLCLLDTDPGRDEKLERVENLTQLAIAEMEQLFENKKVSCDVLLALFFIHSRACVPIPYNFTFDVFRSRFFKCCENHKDVTLETLSHVVAEITHFMEYLDNDEKDLIRSIVTTVLLDESRIQEIKDTLLKESFKELSNLKAGLLKVLSFASNGQQALRDVYERFIREHTDKMRGEAKTNELTSEMVEMLDANSKFVDCLYYPSQGCDKILKSELSRFLNEMEFHAQVGGKITNVLANIIDGALKRGSTTRQMLTKIVTLLSYVYDRDVFLQTYSVYLFQRLGARSTRGLPEEKAVLNEISKVVTETNLKQLHNILDNAQERTDPAAPKLSYILLQQSDVRVQRQPLNTFRPKAYCDLVDTVTKNLQQQNPNHKYSWIDSLATAEVKIKLGDRISSFLMSLVQYGVIEVLSQQSVVSGSMFRDLQVEETRIKQALNSLIRVKLVDIVSGSLTEMEAAQFQLNLKRPAAPKTVIVADNWSLPVKTRRPDTQSRAEATKAMIVRIMKTKKMVKKQQLTELVMNEAANIFPVTEAAIQQAVKQLLATDYLEEKDSTYLIYVE